MMQTLNFNVGTSSILLLSSYSCSAPSRRKFLRTWCLSLHWYLTSSLTSAAVHNPSHSTATSTATGTKNPVHDRTLQERDAKLASSDFRLERERDLRLRPLPPLRRRSAGFTGSNRKGVAVYGLKTASRNISWWKLLSVSFSNYSYHKTDSIVGVSKIKLSCILST